MRLAPAGSSAAKIAQYYADPAKTALDTAAMESSRLGRQLATGQSLYWRARRLASHTLLRARDSIFVDTGPLPSPEIDAPALAATRRIG